MEQVGRTSSAPRSAISSADLPRVTGPYSPAIRAGQLIFVSGQAGVDPSTDELPADGGFEAECRQAFMNVACVLKAANADLSYVVKTLVLYVDASYLPIINAVQAEFFPVDPPARSSAIVELAGGRRITVDAIAALPE